MLWPPIPFHYDHDQTMTFEAPCPAPTIGGELAGTDDQARDVSFTGHLMASHLGAICPYVDHHPQLDYRGRRRRHSGLLMAGVIDLLVSRLYRGLVRSAGALSADHFWPASCSRISGGWLGYHVAVFPDGAGRCCAASFLAGQKPGIRAGAGRRALGANNRIIMFPAYSCLTRWSRPLTFLPVYPDWRGDYPDLAGLSSALACPPARRHSAS